MKPSHCSNLPAVLNCLLIPEHAEENLGHGEIAAEVHIGNAHHTQPWVLYLSADYITNSTLDVLVIRLCLLDILLTLGQCYARTLERSLDFLHVEGFDYVAIFDVIELLKPMPHSYPCATSRTPSKAPREEILPSWTITLSLRTLASGFR